jgi:hypothetical protein
MARVDWDTGWYQKIDKEIDNFMEKLAGDVLDDMIAHAPVRTGALKEDLDKEYDNKSKVARVGAKSVPYAIYVEEGTPPHVIRPNSRKALDWGDALHPVSVVNHPGAEATHFMKAALYKERLP